MPTILFLHIFLPITSLSYSTPSSTNIPITKDYIPMLKIYMVALWSYQWSYHRKSAYLIVNFEMLRDHIL